MNTKTRHQGFTLLEIMVVLFLMAMLSAVAAVSLRSSLTNAKECDVIEGLKHFDRSARQEAMMFGKTVQVEVDIEQDLLTRTTRDEYGRERQETFIVPAPFNLRRVVVNLESTSRHSWSCDTYGRTPTYALFLIGPDENGTGEQSFALVYAGLTGHMTRIDDINVAESLLRELRKP